MEVFWWMWKCKDCGVSVLRRSEQLKHYKLEHRHYGRRHSYPCIYFSCPCTCKTWKALLTHLSRFHQPSQTEVTTFKCLTCHCNQFSTLKEYLKHISQHLLNSETVVCVFQDCLYKTCWTWAIQVSWNTPLMHYKSYLWRLNQRKWRAKFSASVLSCESKVPKRNTFEYIVFGSVLELVLKYIAG